MEYYEAIHLKQNDSYYVRGGVYATITLYKEKSPLSTSDGVTIKMDIADHKNTASFDNKPGSRAYRKKQGRT